MDTEIFALNANFWRTGTPIDVYESLQWVTCFFGVGWFELHAPIQYCETLLNAKYIENTADPRHVAVIEYIEKTVNDDGSEAIMVKGRMIESILGRRVVLSFLRRYKTPIQLIGDLLTDNIISPEDTRRRFKNFAIEEMAVVPDIIQSYCADRSDVLTEVIKICESANIGFKIITIPISTLAMYRMRFSTYSPSRDESNPLILSRDRGNVLSLDYYKDSSNKVDVLYVIGADDVEVEVGRNVSGLNRTEALMDVTNWTIGSETESYQQTLQEKGLLELSKLVTIEQLDATLYPLSGIKLGIDYNLGDYCIILDETLGVTSQQRIVEVSQVWDTKGYSESVRLGSASPSTYDKIKYISQNII